MYNILNSLSSVNLHTELATVIRLAVVGFFFLFFKSGIQMFITAIIIIIIIIMLKVSSSNSTIPAIRNNKIKIQIIKSHSVSNLSSENNNNNNNNNV